MVAPVFASPRLAVKAVLVVVLALCVLSSCSDSEPPERGHVIRYVALGDSTVSGPGINVSSGPCLRSDHNYPSMLADSLKIGDLVDSSCPSATSSDVIAEMHRVDGSVLPAQIDAVTADTNLVTISVGANDDNFIPALFDCKINQKTTKACRKLVANTDDILDTIRRDIVKVIDAVKTKAPRAKIVMVGYLRLMPDSGTCASVPINPIGLAEAAEGEAKLEAAMRGAAKDADVSYVGMRKPSKGHDACASKRERWVNGVTPALGDGIVLHPNENGMKAVERTLRPVVKKLLAKEKG